MTRSGDALRRLVPPWWSRRGGSKHLIDDFVAGLIVALLLIPQGLAYASLAGVPAQYGLYASLLPLVLYPLFGSSSVMSIGPVAITALLTGGTLAPLGLDGMEYVGASALLAFLSGLMLFAMGLARLGAIAQLLSHPVVTAFITGAALLIIVSQLGPLIGVALEGDNAITQLGVFITHLDTYNGLSAAFGLGALLILLFSRRFTLPLLQAIGLNERLARTGQRLIPMVVVLAATALVFVAGWDERTAVVGALPSGTPSFSVPPLRPDWIASLWLPALVIGLLGFIESIAIAQAFARQRKEPIDANAELRALGAANIGSALAGGFAVTGGFSRTLVNAEAGARSPVAGLFAALFVLLALWFATDVFAWLPQAVLAATIIAAAVQLVDFRAFRRAWKYDRAEALAMWGTTLGVLLFGIETGIAIGAGFSVATVVWRLSRPHVAALGLVPGTQHFRNVDRHRVETRPTLLLVRVDENLYFVNAEAVERKIRHLVRAQPALRHLVLVMSSVSRIDVTALDMLQRLDHELHRQGITLHLAEVKGPVADRLDGFGLSLRGDRFFSAWQAWQTLAE